MLLLLNKKKPPHTIYKYINETNPGSQLIETRAKKMKICSNWLCVEEN